MNDDDVAALLDGQSPLVVIEAPAGCGKTYQGANFAQRETARLKRGRILILTHTHAACSVFAKATKTTASHVEVKTIDGLIVQIATAYYKSLSLPPDPSSWARHQSDRYGILAEKVANLLRSKPMVAEALADRYPVIIGDEHQDTSTSQNSIILALCDAGARLRLFGDPMQQIYGGHSRTVFAQGRAQWETLKRDADFAELEYPHRWDSGSSELGTWVLQARERLKTGQPIDLTGALPEGLNVLQAENRAQRRTSFQLYGQARRPIDEIERANENLLVLTAQNETATSLRAFWNRRIPIWEGYTRDHLGNLMSIVTNDNSTPENVCAAMNKFMYGVSVGYGANSHGNRLITEVREGCSKSTRGKPALLQAIARHILDQPNNVGVAAALSQIEQHRKEQTAGFSDIKIDNARELHDAIRLGEYEDADEGFAELHRRRTYARPMPPSKAISTIHKAKGLECENAILLPCDQGNFRGTDYARCKLYVAISRARRSLTLVVCPDNPSPLLQI